eukprot:Mrub_04648.p2 GENE.Mrub_04648~~Mrub_04648.p2  ORF type:complete len:131 (+),score=8.30 Mrub_04648:600-992(+)
MKISKYKDKFEKKSYSRRCSCKTYNRKSVKKVTSNLVYCYWYRRKIFWVASKENKKKIKSKRKENIACNKKKEKGLRTFFIYNYTYKGYVYVYKCTKNKKLSYIKNAVYMKENKKKVISNNKGEKYERSA